ncbi:hypothetical protein ACFRMQ_05195 [Kitasatospora sp. NPDC056783]|uniref:hypothetical protein n=1 Tax=Kitasatospora sp. NPDC056783 TaxID=3345943 RepID=UPI0036CC161B
MQLNGANPAAATPVQVANVGTISNSSTLRRYVRVTMGVPHADNGDWSHDEL